MATSSSSETTGKRHPYQLDDTPGAPTGAFEARKTRGGLFIRVDMPGVPDNGVKVVKYNETRTITFSGKAPPLWTRFDSPETRIYGGYVVLDCDITDLDFESRHEKGCLRMYFPRCDGSLHFLSRPRSSSSGPAAFLETPLTSVEDDSTGRDEEYNIGAPPTVTFVLHDPQNYSGMRLDGGAADDINPYLLSGVKGVYEHKIVTSESGEHLIYVRVDVPDTCLKTTAVIEAPLNMVMFGAMAMKKEYYSRFDKAARDYQGILSPACNCCTYNVVKFDIASGVLRFLVRKTANTGGNNPSPDLLVHSRICDDGSSRPLWLNIHGLSAMVKMHPRSNH